MKNFAALILAVSASSAFAGETNSLQVSGKAARELYDALSVDVTVPESEQGNGGINPLRGRKDLQTSDGQLNVSCEVRLYSKDCTISKHSR